MLFYDVHIMVYSILIYILILYFFNTKVLKCSEVVSVNLFPFYMLKEYLYIPSFFFLTISIFTLSSSM